MKFTINTNEGLWLLQSSGVWARLRRGRASSNLARCLTIISSCSLDCVHVRSGGSISHTLMLTCRNCFKLREKHCLSSSWQYFIGQGLLVNRARGFSTQKRDFSSSTTTKRTEAASKIGRRGMASSAWESKEYDKVANPANISSRKFLSCNLPMILTNRWWSVLEVLDVCSPTGVEDINKFFFRCVWALRRRHHHHHHHHHRFDNFFVGQADRGSWQPSSLVGGWTQVGTKSIFNLVAIEMN